MLQSSPTQLTLFGVVCYIEMSKLFYILWVAAMAEHLSVIKLQFLEIIDTKISSIYGCLARLARHAGLGGPENHFGRKNE